jgi:hypothetical protein
MREDILRRVNKLLASFMPMQIAAKPQVKISKKKRNHKDCASIPPKEEGGGDNT